ncbi:MAG: MgtC/SapB family protein [Paenibacillus dendritiformis]|uniref:MgtC/SapB family protein n=1 Tax=Paenibacillus dendritiformis TaxID=130049 RepID=UPI00143D2B4B|nr:MgtC/SapB family protein [uncultured Paenibacillus sp.]MDU5143851.1 MgtC/SapB family protein [Paenibacillus dendritiformis]NKI24320.1 MgtC/SapB family protein [Paenibacillus dendritiformis]NRF99502.1 MgtC/SapB family protein [Paenibacillus dendritiformis]
MTSPWTLDPASICLRLLLSLVLGGIIGFEREMNQHAAGFRTNILVCIGSSLIMLLSIYGFNAFVDEPNVRMDPARLAAQVVSGIGFLGAGTIIRTGLSVKGLTTAATLWVMAAIGLAVGAGFYFPAILTCGLVFVSLQVLNKIELRYLVANKALSVEVTSYGGPETLGTISRQLLAERVEIRNMNVADAETPGPIEGSAPPLEITITIVMPKKKPMSDLVERLKGIPGVTAVKIE